MEIFMVYHWPWRSYTLHMYSPTKGVSKIGQYDIGQIIRLCKHMDNLLSIKDMLAASSSKRKKKKALRLDKAIFQMRRKIKHLHSEVHKKCRIWCHYHSNIVNRKTRKITRKTVHYQFRQRPCYYPKWGICFKNLQTGVEAFKKWEP